LNAALLLQAAVRLRSGWRFAAILNPTDEGGLIAPADEVPIMPRCTPECIKERIAASSRHTVRVQKARSASRRTETERLPPERLA